jgi:hypothetical protein
MTQPERRYYGKYRGKVTDNIDPLALGRIKATVPAIVGGMAWAMPATPFAGKRMGLGFVPPVGANVWVEYEGGDPDYPIWSGCFWGPGECPPDLVLMSSKGDTGVVLQLDGFKLMVNQQAPNKGLVIEVSPPLANGVLRIEASPDGVILKNGELVALTLGPDKLELVNNNQAKVTLTAQGMELSMGALSVKLAGSAIELASGPASVKVASSSLDLANGASSVKLSPAAVNINNGALEVM